MDNLSRWPRVKAGLRVVALSLCLLKSGTAVNASPVVKSAPSTTNRSASAPARADWALTLEQIAKGVVSIQIDATRAFDTENNATGQATGFVVDAKRGLILTNRHVVTSGPVTAQAVFLNREEVPLYPVYRDPVHDFGFYRYDPSKLRFMAPSEIPLYPAGAQVGTEIRVVGNDAGEQLSFLSGTIARLDRHAPAYGFGRYNDFNTFYYQAASSTSGGSSGSPVVDISGRAIALNAGGATGAASSFYLPLDRVVRALRLIQAGMPVPRGTLQVVFDYKPFDELHRLGLSADTEAQVRREFPQQVGMLVVGQVQPGSPAAGQLEVGDLLVRINGHWVTEFQSLSEVLDDSVGKTIQLEIQRGGEVLQRSLSVTDLHSITPAEYLEFGEAVLHPLSYQQARHLNVPIRGIYVANPGYVLGSAGIPRGSILVQFNGRPVQTLDDIEAVLAGLEDQSQAVVRFVTMDDVRTTQVRSVRIDRRWFIARRCVRDDVKGYWPCRELAPPPAAKPPLVASTNFSSNAGDEMGRRLAPSLVYVNFDMPYLVSGIAERSYHGTGVIVDTQRGLVVVDRNTVPVALGDVRLTFGGALEVPGRVEFINPLHNLAVISYDPKLIGTTPVQAVTFNAVDFSPGEPVWVVGLRSDQRVMNRQARVSALDPVAFPLSRTLAFRDTNAEVLSLVDGPNDFDGLIVNKSGAVSALWSSFAFETPREMTQENFGILSDVINPMVTAVRDKTQLRSLEVELGAVPLATARRYGLPDFWVNQFQNNPANRRQVLSIVRLVAGTPAAQWLQTGDLLLSVDGHLVSRFAEVERAAQKPRVHLVVWRNNTAQEIDLDTVALGGHDIDRIVQWAGVTLQSPHRALPAQRGIVPQGVYVAYFAYGSPATRAGLLAGRRIVAVDDKPTLDLDSFLAAIRGKADRSAVRLKTVALNNAVDVITVKLDMHDWPTYELRREESGWVRHALD